MKIINLIKKKNNDLKYIKSNIYIQNPKEVFEQVKQNEKIIKFIYKDHVLYTNNDNAVLYHIVNSVSKLEKLASSSKKSTEGISLDIGANVGLFSYFYKIHNPDVFIYLFEPDPVLCEIIYKNLDRYKEFKIINKAISDKTGISDMYINTESRQTSSLDIKAVIPFASSNNIYSSQLQSITLDDFCQEEKINSIETLKIDIQGLEFRSLSSGNRILEITNEIIVEISFFMPDAVKLVKLLDNQFPFYDPICDILLGADVIFKKEKNDT